MQKLAMCVACIMTFAAASMAMAAGPARPITHGRGKIHRVIAASPGSVTLYDQNNDENGVAIVSTNFTDDFLIYSSYGADDFTVSPGHKWIIREVEVAGTYETADGPAQSENVLFYKDKRHRPGKLLAECDNLLGLDQGGSFAITLPASCKVSLRGGRTYWISVVANMDFGCCGQWAWQTRNAQNANPAVWENPENGFGTGCVTWNLIATCFGDAGQGSDFMFALKGKDIQQ